MAQIVIEISKDVYDNIKKENTIKNHLNTIDWAVRNGIVLPARHGNLIDVDALTPDYIYENGEFHAVGVVQLQYAPKIIPADMVDEK